MYYMFCGVVANHWKCHYKCMFHYTRMLCTFTGIKLLSKIWMNYFPTNHRDGIHRLFCCHPKCCGIILFNCTGNCSTQAINNTGTWWQKQKYFHHLLLPNALLSHLCHTLLACLQCQTDFPSPDGPVSPFLHLPCPFLPQNHRHKFVSL